MNNTTAPRSNFEILARYDEQLLRLGMLAERYFPEDPNTSILKMRQFAEALAQHLASRVGIYTSSEEAQYELLRRLQDQGSLPREVFQLFDEVRRLGNRAVHELAGDHRAALSALKLGRQLALWFHWSFGDPSYKAGPFIPPSSPPDESEELRAELSRLRAELEARKSIGQESSSQLEALGAKYRAAADESAFWAGMAQEAESAKAALELRLAEEQAVATAKGARALAGIVTSAAKAAGSIRLDEAETRQLIDAQLRQAGWEADSAELRYAKGARPERGHNRAISEWPTGSGPADYILFFGLEPIATVEAKRRNLDVSAHLKQAERYARDYRDEEGRSPEASYDGHRIPFAFSTNGRPFLRQLEMKSGIWFRDLRRPENLGRALEGWYGPEGLAALRKSDEAASYERLEEEPFDYGFTVRDYQRDAILTVEKAIAEGRRAALVAMATGTGKTKTCIALVYRLLKAQRFRRILFLVDRSALGEQAAGAFKDTRMEGLASFADIFGVKELEDARPDRDTQVHIATVQGMVHRILYPAEGEEPPAVDSYDCIVVDECHRGYLLDRELSETELGFRSFEEYVSKYRRVLDRFDAVKIGLTATPALHTTQIFGPPIYVYGYREAVIDGWLVDHEPTVRIQTELSSSGIKWEAGEEVPVYDPATSQIELFTTADELSFEVEDFNRKVITENFNRVVCEYLATELDPSSRRKTLVFCSTDAHADLVVSLLKKAFASRYGSVEDGAVVKITAAADRPLELIKRYKNEALPNVAVTVDLLTTGIDVPEICNLVFLRRVNSRILYDQMLGRGTRLCDAIGKESFRVFDAVGQEEAIGKMSAMRPVVVDPHIGFAQLQAELSSLEDEDAIRLARDQFLAKIQSKKRHLGEVERQDFETAAGMEIEDFVTKLRSLSLVEIAPWFIGRPGLGEILDRRADAVSLPIPVSSHQDKLKNLSRGYQGGMEPKDYLEEFSAFLRENRNEIPALLTVLTRPRELTRRELRELALELDRAGYSEASLESAWRDLTNEDIAARIVGYIRRAALGESLEPYGERVDSALRKMLASRSWSGPQREWLKRIAAQTKANIVVDREALDDQNLVFKREGGGFERLDRLFEGQLEKLLGEFKDSLWQPSA